MPTVKEVREKFPDYSDLSDQDLADALHAKFYGDMPKEDFYKQIGVSAVTPTPSAGAQPPADTRPDWVRRDDEYLGGSSELPQGPPPSMIGQAASNFVPGVGAASAILGKEMEFKNPDSMLPTGVQDVPTVAENIRTGHPWKAAGQALGVIPDVGYAAKGVGLLGRAAKALPAAAEAPMTLDALKTAKNAAYAQAEQAGVVVKPDEFKHFVDSLEGKLRGEGYDPDLHSNVAPVLKRLRQAADEPTQKTLQDIEILRRVAGAGRQSATPGNKDQLAKSYTILDSIDDFENNLQPHQLVNGDSKEAMALLQQARSLTNKSKKIEDIQQIVKTAEDLDDPKYVQNQFRSIVKNPKRFNRFSADEKEIVKKVAQTGALDAVGKLLAPSDSGFGLLKGTIGAGLGYGALGPAGLAVPFVGTGAKAAGNMVRRGNVNTLEQTISRGGAAPSFIDRFKAQRARQRLLETE